MSGIAADLNSVSKRTHERSDLSIARGAAVDVAMVPSMLLRNPLCNTSDARITDGNREQ